MKIGKVLAFVILCFVGKVDADVVIIGTDYNPVPDIDVSILTESDYNRQQVGQMFGLVGRGTAKAQAIGKNHLISDKINQYLQRDGSRYLEQWSTLATKALNSETNFFKVDKENNENKFYFQIHEFFDIRKHHLESDKTRVNHIINLRLINKTYNKEMLNLDFSNPKVYDVTLHKFIEDDHFVTELRNKSLEKLTDTLYFRMREKNIIFDIAKSYTKNNPFIDYKGLLKKSTKHFSVKPFSLPGWSSKKIDDFHTISYPASKKEIVQIKTEISPLYWEPEKKLQDQLLVEKEVIFNYLDNQIGSEWLIEEKGCPIGAVADYFQLCYLSTDKSKRRMFNAKSSNGFLVIHAVDVIGGSDMYLKYFEANIASYITNFKFLTK